MWPEDEYVVALYGNPFSSVSKEAREIATEKYASERRKKVAFISDNTANIILIRFFIIINKPKTPIKIFKSEEAAFDWLNKKD